MVHRGYGSSDPSGRINTWAVGAIEVNPCAGSAVATSNPETSAAWAQETPLLGFGLPVSGRWATLGTVRYFARRAENCGYASLWVFQRLLSPVGHVRSGARDSMTHVAAVLDVADRYAVCGCPVGGGPVGGGPS
jgi:hypothetical protein